MTFASKLIYVSISVLINWLLLVVWRERERLGETHREREREKERERERERLREAEREAQRLRINL